MRRRRNETFLTKTKAIWCGKLAFWAFQLCNWQKPIPSTLAPPISLDTKISSLSALVPWWSPGPNRRRSELLLQSKATRSPGHRRPSRYHAFGRDEALGDLFFRKLSPGWLVISHIFASCMWRCGGSFNSIRQGDFCLQLEAFFKKTNCCTNGHDIVFTLDTQKHWQAFACQTKFSWKTSLDNHEEKVTERK